MADSSQILASVNSGGADAQSVGLRPGHAEQFRHELGNRQPSEQLLRRSNQRLELLSDVASQLLMSGEPQRIVNSLCQKVLAFLDCHAFFNYLVDEDKGCLHLNACAGIPDKAANRIEWLEYGAAVCGCAARDGCRIVAEDILNTPDPRTDLVKSFGIKAYACHPLFSEGRVLGTLSFGTRSRTTFAQDELALMKVVADHIAIAMQRMITQDQLKVAKEAAEAASRAKDQLLAVVSHELRTPLNPILAAASYLQRRADLPPDAREELTIIRRNVEQEARLVDDLLNFTRLDRGAVKLKREAVDAHTLLHHILGRFRGDIEQKSIELSIAFRAAEHTIWADPGQIEEAFASLLSNAVKFSHPGGRISLRSSNSDQQFVIEIADSGVGIEPDVLPRLFRAFQQGESALSRRYGGMGLGLSICKGIVDLHGGTLSVQSDGRDKGARFILQLATAPSAPDAARDGIADRNRTILLVEDHADTLRLMCKLLKGFGHRVTTATCVGAAIAHLERGRFDLLVSDIGLPDGSGLDVMREAKARHGMKGIALSGFGQEEDIQRSLQAGFGKHLTKPINVQQLEQAIDSISA